ncbi:protein nrt1/ ptr family 4.4 [Phtheirospermum japonicum]|uniref:Protein nrt1/ ptr family 4.4 n=1 Tax=Phtheirospermum japonicum TaxID=374723 RepID=A0A830D2A5_9LAMI|nr:protein nrt1/ ptr family 4.4 [Phtheirospermum japonicum]
MDRELESTTTTRDEADDVMTTTVDWRGRPSKLSKHGGMTAAVFVLGLQGFEMMAIAAVGSNLITYAFNDMHLSLSNSANTVTNFVGTVFLLSLLGGFLSDSYLGSFWTMLIFGFVELTGFILLATQAHVEELRPAKCIMGVSNYCEEVKGYKAWIFYGALYLVALGSGCLKPNIISLGADQFEARKQSKKLSTYFNCAYFAFCTGELVALTLLVWIQTHSGMDVGFGVSAAAMAAALIFLVSGSFLYRNSRPRGSIFTPIAQVIIYIDSLVLLVVYAGMQNPNYVFIPKVFVAAIYKRKQICPSNPEMLHRNQATSNVTLIHTDKFVFLDKACVKVENGNGTRESSWRLCSVSQVEQVKILLSLVPIFACTIIFNTILAQLQTFSVQQGRTMNTRLARGFEIPPASLQSIPYIMLIFVVPLYETLFVPLARRVTRKDSGISPLQRVGTGLFIATFSMVAAAVVERKRRRNASDETLSIFWIAPQFLIFGLSEMFTAVGLIEFFYKQSIQGMPSFLTAMTYCSYSFGFYLSSVLVSLVNRVTSTTGSGGGGWLSDNDLDKDRLDLFYWLLAALSLVNFFNYLFWSTWYSCNPSVSHTPVTLPGEPRDLEKQIPVTT